MFGFFYFFPRLSLVFHSILSHKLIARCVSLWPYFSVSIQNRLIFLALPFEPPSDECLDALLLDPETIYIIITVNVQLEYYS